MFRMSKNYLWLFFIVIVAISAGWFSFKSGYEFYKYYSMDSQAFPLEINWTVKERASDRYTLNSNYFYKVKEDTYSGETHLKTPVFKNREAAEKYIKEISKEKKTIWYSSRQPKDSSIQRELPIKESVYTIVLWGLFFYFLGLGFYIGKL